MKTAASSGITFTSLLGLILIGLKLAEVGVVATWPWWAVLAPLWVPSAFYFGLAAIVGMVYICQKVWSR